MVKKFLKGIVVLLFVLAVLNPKLVLANEVGESEFQDEIEESFHVPQYSFYETFTFTQYAFGTPIYMNVYVNFTIEFTYEESYWANINYANISLNSVTVNGAPASSVTNYDYNVYDTYAVRIVDVNSGYPNAVRLTIYIIVDEYGEVTTSANIQPLS